MTLLLFSREAVCLNATSIGNQCAKKRRNKHSPSITHCRRISYKYNINYMLRLLIYITTFMKLYSIKIHKCIILVAAAAFNSIVRMDGVNYSVARHITKEGTNNEQAHDHA
jgi:hypothetical protein